MPNRIKITPAVRKLICEMWEEGRGYGSRSKGKRKRGFFTVDKIAKKLNVSRSSVYMIASGER